MKSILFLAPYPTVDNIKDGMINRIKSIDSMFTSFPRKYLDIAIKFKKKEVARYDNIEVYKLSLFLHFWLIVKLLFKADYIYSHSIWGGRYVFFLFPFCSGRFILDIHGVVPEENRLTYNSPIRYWVLNVLEYFYFLKISVAICVTNSMRSHYNEKYTHYKGDFLIYNILPSYLNELILHNNVSISSADTKVNVIYSGGVSKWQNIDLMLDVIGENITECIKYTLLVNNISFVKTKLVERGIENVVELKSVQPDELNSYYMNADYAFILRDDNVVNNVANPTKLVEYLAFGIVPIVLSPNIGDYLSMNYEYINVDDFSTEISKPNTKSIANISIARNICESNKSLKLIDIILK